MNSLMGNAATAHRMKSLTLLMAATILSFTPSVARAQGAGYWHTNGNQVLDSSNKPLRISGINWSGFETPAEVVHGLYAQDYKLILDGIKSNGYNTIRLPFSNQMVEYPVVPSSDYLAFYNASGPMNTDLEGLNSLEILDRVIAYAGQIGLRVILDNHRSEDGETAEANGLWYTPEYPESNWINDWQMLAERYKSNPTVVGMDLRNEPHSVGNGGAFWTSTNIADDWHLAAERAGNAILKINPKLLIFVEGTDTQANQSYWWGGNLQGVKNAPVVLNVKNQLVYSAHEYGPDLYPQSWFNAKTTPATLEALWNATWGYVSNDKIAPVWVGEFGTLNTAASLKSNVAGSQGQWFQTLASYLQSNPNVGWSYWDESEDSYALLDSNWDTQPVSPEKQQMLAALQFKLGVIATPSCTTTPATPTRPEAASASSSSIQLSWAAVTPPANCAVSYTVYRGGAKGFAPSSTNQVAAGLQSPSFADSSLKASTTYYYAVKAVDAHGISAASAQASAVTEPAPQIACHVTYEIVNSWDTGFQASIAIQNTGVTNLSSWTLAFAFPGNQAITDFWVGVEAQKGDNVTVSNESYNGVLAAGASVQGLGFIANWSGTNAAPASFTLNGVTCK